MIDTVPFVIGVSIYNWKIVDTQHTTDNNSPVMLVLPQLNTILFYLKL